MWIKDVGVEEANGIRRKCVRNPRDNPDAPADIIRHDTSEMIDPGNERIGEEACERGCGQDHEQGLDRPARMHVGRMVA